MDIEQFRKALRETAGEEFSGIPAEEEIDYDFSEDFSDFQDLPPKKRRFSAFGRVAAILLCIGCVMVLAGNAEALQSRVFSPLATLFSMGKYKQGFNGSIYEDSFGEYYIYDGSEITIPYGVFNSAGNGVEVQIFLNGQPQPFKTESDPTTRYTHVLYPIKQVTLQNLTFTPITGKTGDILELRVILKSLSADPQQEFRSGEMTTIWLFYEADPPAPELPYSPYSADALTVTTAESFSAAADIDLFINGRVGWKADIEDPEHITLGASLEGPLNGEYRLIFMIDHQPVLIHGEPSILVEADGSQRKLLYEITLSMDPDAYEHCFHVELIPVRSPDENNDETIAPLSQTHFRFWFPEQ